MANPSRVDNVLCAAPDKLAGLRKTLADLKDCINDMKQEYECDGGPLTDDCQSLQRFCIKFEHLLQTGLRDRSGVMTGKKDYWDYFRDCLSGNKYLKDGLHFVKSLAELKSSLGRGRAFIRFALVHQRLADTVQQCLICQKHNRDWYIVESFIHQRGISDDLVTALYDLNDLKFDLAPRGYDLDTAWPTFSHKTPHGTRNIWKPPSRSSSITSLTSIPSLEVYHTQPASSLSSYNEHLSESVASYENLITDEMDNGTNSGVSDIDQLNHVVELERENTELRASLEREKEDKLRMSSLERDLRDIDLTFCEKEIQWQREKTELLNKISNLEQQAEQTMAILSVVGDSKKVDEHEDSEHYQVSCRREDLITRSPNNELVTKLQLQLEEVLKTENDRLIEIQRLQEEREKLLETMQGLLEEQGRASDLEKNLNNVVKEKRELEIKLEQLTMDLTVSRDQLGSAKLSLQEASFCDVAYQDILREKSEFEDRICRLTEELQCSNKSIQELTDDNMSSNARVVELLSLVSKWELENDQLTQNLSQTKLELADCRQAMHELKNEKNNLTEVVQKAGSERNIEEARLSTHISELKEALHAKDEDNAKLISQRNTLQAECAKITGECEKKQVECEQLKKSVVKLEAQIQESSKLVDSLNITNEEIRAVNESTRREIVEMEVKWRQAVSEKDHAVTGLKDDLEAMSGSVQRRERMWESARERMEQEIESLQADIALKTTEYQHRLMVADEHLRTVRADYEITQLQQQEELDDLKQCLGVAEHENSSLKYQLQQRGADICKLQAETCSSIEQLSSDLKLMKSDNKQLKTRIVQLLRDKDNLWQKSNKLSNERRVRRSNCWRNSADILKCMACNTDFTVTLRKHHCRECGRVFCWACCNNWVQTAHSERKERVCNECISDIQRASTTSSGESDSNDDADEASDCDNVTITSCDPAATCFDGDSTLTEIDEVPCSVPAPKEVLSQSMSTSGSWSVRDSARTAVSWVTGVVSRSLSSSAAGGMHTSVTVKDSSSGITPQELSNAAPVNDTDSLHAFDNNPMTSDNRELDEDADASVGVDDAPLTSSDRVDLLIQERATATESSNLLPRVDVGQFQESDQLLSLVNDTGMSTDIAVDKPQPSETISVTNNIVVPCPATREEQVTPSPAAGGEAFDIITEEEVFECVRYPLPDPKVDCGPLIRSIDLNNHLVESSNQVLVKAGRSYAVPISIDVPGFILVWQFTTQPKGITFSLMYKECDIIPYRECDKLISDCKVNSHHKPCEGQLEAHRAGVYTLLFDNTSSRFTAKQLQYKLELKRANQPSFK